MFSSGYQMSDLTDMVEYSPEVRPVLLPRKYSMKKQIDSPHDQGLLGICVSVCVSDICKYVYRGKKGIEWKNELSYFYDRREDKGLDGMSPREALDIAIKDGFIKSYAKVGSLLVIQHCILSNGPVILCLPVWGSYKDQFWQKSYGDELEGYHAVTLIGYDKDKGTLTLRNSWGLSYGFSGYSTFPVEDLKYTTEAWTVFA